MFEFLYPTSYFASLTGLILWFYFKEDRKLSGFMQKAFFLSLLAYGVSLFFSSGLFSTKLFALCRDLFTMGIIAQFFNYIKNNKLVFSVMLMVLFGSFQFKGKSYLQSTFATTTDQAILSNLDKAGELLVEINESHSISEIESILSSYDLSASIAFHPANEAITDLDDFYTIDVPESHTHQLEDILSELRNAPVVDAVEYNEVFKVNPIETKIRPPEVIDYGINDPAVKQLWGFEVMKMQQLYKTMQQISPTKKAKVFVVDSGIDARHEDLQGRYRSIKSAYDKDTNGHGTHCAGIAAAITNNKKGVASAFPSNEYAEVSSIKVMNPFGLITQQRLIEGIIEAIDNGADVISVSIGGPSREAKQEAFQKVVKYANKSNAIIVVAAGNSNMNATGFTPANADGVITVSALDQTVNRAVFSNMVGDLKMGIAAPGVDIYSTFPNNKYKALSGTSMACPYVAGLIGLMKSIKPDLTTKQAYKILKTTGQKTKDNDNTGPLIQPAKAIDALVKGKY